MQGENPRSHQIFPAMQLFLLPVQQMQPRLHAFTLKLQRIAPRVQSREHHLFPVARSLSPLSATHVNARIAAGNPSVVIARTQTCACSSSVMPAWRALRTAECVPPSSPAPTDSATFTRRRVFSSSGPALWHLSARALNASQTSGWVVRKSPTKGGT